VTRPSITPDQSRALIAAVFDLQAQVRQIQGTLESVLASERERITLLRDLRQAVEHTRRLVNERDALFAMVGRFMMSQHGHADVRAEIQRFVSEHGAH
jgi:ribosomal 50S subunit-associated protein YjgA (DUF615 family)